MNTTKLKIQATKALLAFMVLILVLPVAGELSAQTVAPQISSVVPDVSVVAGSTSLTINGTNLTDTVQFFDGSAARHTVKGQINNEKTQTTVVAPASLPVGNATVKIYLNSTTVSNGKLIRISSSQVENPNSESGSIPNSNPTFATPTSIWNPSHTGNGWWPYLSPDGRFVAYGNWGESWVTDLQTKQNWDFSKPEGLPEGGRCMGGQWKTADTLLFVCDSIPGENGFYQYEVKVGEWVARKTNSDPGLVLATQWLAKDGHWAAYAAVTQIVKDNKALTRAKPGGALSISEDALVHACNNSNRSICVYQGDKKTKTYTVKSPMHGTDVYKNHIVYGGYGPARGIDSKGKDTDISAVKGMFESVPKIVPVDGNIWVATNAWPANESPFEVDQFMIIRPWGERRSILVEAAAVHFNIIHTGSSFVIAYNDDRGNLTVKTIRDNSPRSDICGSACPESPLTGDASMKIVAQKDMGAGTFPDVVFFNNKVWMAMMIDRKLKLYSFNKNLTGQQEIDIPFSGFGQAFPRLMEWRGVLWLAFRDGDNSSNVPESIKLWRGDTGAIEDLGGGMGNDPVALGNGYVAWQKLQADGKTWKVVRRAVEGENVSVIRNGVATGLSRILPNGRIVTIDEDRLSVPWGMNAWHTASPLVVTTDVTPTDDNGVAGRFSDNPRTEFNLWAGQRAHTPHAASDGEGTYAVVTWNPNARIAVITGPRPSTPKEEVMEVPVCDPWPTDADEISECIFYELYNPSPRYYEPATDPANPVQSGVRGVSGLGVAFNSKDGTNLVVGGSGDIVAQLQNAEDQSSIGSSVQLDQSGSDTATNPRVVYNSETSQFLVIWHSRGSALWGRILGGDAAPVGSDFLIAQSLTNTSSNVIYDHTNDSYLVVYERNGVVGRLVSTAGQLGEEKTIASGNTMNGAEGSVALNENINEYWVTSIRQVGDTKKVALNRLAKNLASSGEALELSLNNAPSTGGSTLACSKTDKGCMVAWGSDQGVGGKGVYGVAVEDNLSVSGEIAFITPMSAQYGKTFTLPVINYNSWTESFFLSSADDSGGVALCEINFGTDCGLVNQVIAPTVFAKGPMGKVLSWFKANIAHAETGNFNPTNTPTNFGASVYAVRDQEGIHGVNMVTQSVAQNNSGATNTPRPPRDVATPSGGGNPCTIGGILPGDNKLSTLPMCINQIYVWSLGLGALLALLMTVLGGYMYMTAAGNAEQTSKGKEYIMGSITGLFLLFTAFLLLRTINPDLTNFNMGSFNLFNNRAEAPATGGVTPGPAPANTSCQGPRC